MPAASDATVTWRGNIEGLGFTRSSISYGVSYEVLGGEAKTFGEHVFCLSSYSQRQQVIPGINSRYLTYTVTVVGTLVVYVTNSLHLLQKVGFSRAEGKCGIRVSRDLPTVLVNGRAVTAARCDSQH